MKKIRTDLAMEARELWRESAEDTTKLNGVEAAEEERGGCRITRVNILDDRGVKALGKPVGAYVTLELTELDRHDDDSFWSASSVLAEELTKMLKLDGGDSVLVVGLGNSAITPDAIGPKTLEYTVITRHLVEHLPEHFGTYRQVSALSPGVLGTTGLESAEIVRGVAERTRPDRIVVVDALASRRTSRVCATVQLADTGIIPGSGVGNARSAFNRESLGVPVVAVGVPTVVDAATLAMDLTEAAGGSCDSQRLSEAAEGLIVTPRDIDASIRDMAKVVGFGINAALHEGMSRESMGVFLA